MSVYLGKNKIGVSFANYSSGNVNDLVDVIYPIGSIYLSTVNVNPATLFGGTWEQIEDVFLLAGGSAFAPGTSGGEAEHTLTEAELPNITGQLNIHGAGSATVLASVSGHFTGIGSYSQYRSGGSNTGGSTSVGQAKLSFGSDEPHNNMPPYLAVYAWERKG